MFKRIVSAFFACCTAAGVLTACGTAPQTQAQGAAASPLVSDGKVQIVTTIFPLYDWTRQILGTEVQDEADLQFLLGDGVDFHNYQATAKDILTVSQADLLVYVGGTSDAWIEQACEQNPNPNRVEINLMELLSDRLKTEELAEGMEHSHEDEDEHAHTPEEEAALHDEHGHEGAVYDEHVWLSIQNAEIVCDALADALAQLLPESTQQLEQNAEAYQAELSELDAQFRQAADSASTKTLLFADRFPFRYLTDDYGLSYYAAFTGCSTDTQASFETISFLSEKVGELSLHTILTIDDSDGKIAQTVAHSSGTAPEILSMNSMQSITRAQADEGVTYLSVMQENLTVLRTALGA